MPNEALCLEWSMGLHLLNILRVCAITYDGEAYDYKICRVHMCK